MSQPLPIGEYQWVNMVEQPELFFSADAIMNLEDDSNTGYIFEVDLHYPESLHITHNDFPFCAEKRKLPKDAFDIVKKRALLHAEKLKMNQLEDTGEKARKIVVSKIDKLLLTLHDKEKYVVHYRMLAMALRHGLKLEKVHRILKFKQSLWLKPYIELNTELRKKATNDFEKSFFKLLNNAIFGKTMENVRSRVEMKLLSKWDTKFGVRMNIAKPNFKRCVIFDEDLVAIELKTTSVLMNKPIAVGMSILDISKLTMYGFLYDYLKPKYGEKVRVVYTDTDSFILNIETADFYKEMRDNIDKFDTSDYPWPNVYGIERKNKKIPGLFKDELNGNVLIEFAGLRAKCYALRSLDNKSYNESVKKSKGVKKNVVKKSITFNDFIYCLENNCEVKRFQNTIRSLLHKVYSIRQEKIALSPFDDKRYIVQSNGIDTLAWGHYAVDMYEEVAKENF